MNAKVNSQQLNLLQSTHLDKLDGYFPGMKGATLASLYGLDEASYQATRAEFDKSARDAALELLKNATFARQAFNKTSKGLKKS